MSCLACLPFSLTDAIAGSPAVFVMRDSIINLCAWFLIIGNSKTIASSLLKGEDASWWGEFDNGFAALDGLLQAVDWVSPPHYIEPWSKEALPCADSCQCTLKLDNGNGRRRAKRRKKVKEDRTIVNFNEINIAGPKLKQTQKQRPKKKPKQPEQQNTPSLRTRNLQKKKFNNGHIDWFQTALPIVHTVWVMEDKVPAKHLYFEEAILYGPKAVSNQEGLSLTLESIGLRVTRNKVEVLASLGGYAKSRPNCPPDAEAGISISLTKDKKSWKLDEKAHMKLSVVSVIMRVEDNQHYYPYIDVDDSYQPAVRDVIIIAPAEMIEQLLASGFSAQESLKSIAKKLYTPGEVALVIKIGESRRL